MPAKRLLIAVLSVVTPGLCTLAQEQAPGDDAPAEVTIGEKGSAQDPLSGRKPVVAVEPEQEAEVRQVEGIMGVPASRVKVDPRVLGVAPGEPLPRLRREGETLRKRDGRLLPTGDRGYAVFILDSDPKSGEDQPLAMVVAPCITLESMERLLEDRGDDLRFTITGQVHTYRGVNYLLPTSQPKPWLLQQKERSEAVGEEGADEGAAAEAEPEAGAEDKEAGVNTEAQADAGAEAGGESATPDADEVLEELIKSRRDAPGGVDASAGGSGGDDEDGPVSGKRVLDDPLLLGLDPDQAQAELKDEGQFIVARTGRLVRSADGAHALFVLDADGRGAPEPPMVMQACKLLETMESTIAEQGDDIPFVVTGQVYVYRGANYLLPTIVKREFDRGNLE